MKHLFIINPVAGKGKSLKLIPEIKRVFAGRQEEYSVEITQRPGHAVQIAAEYAQKGFSRIYSVGGDGTLNEVLNGIAGSGVSLGVIPGGSGNDFFRSLSSETDMKRILEKTVNGAEKRIDMARANGRYFMNISSLGFDAAVAHHTRLFKRLPLITGKVAYILGIFATVVRNKHYSLHVTLEDTGFEDKHLLVAVANGRYYGGGMLPVPMASFDDGMLDICAVRKVKRLRLLRLFPRYMKGLHRDMAEVNFYRTGRVTIRSDGEVPLNIDGEVEFVKEVVFEVVRGGISIILPE